jgi:NAD(P)-dependent dehydrogenase (short-subunit alcohol dehydrogenase family)
MITEKRSEPSSHPLAVVTGAAHRLGRAVALALAQEGYAIGLHYHHSVEKAEATARELEAAGAVVTLLQADLAQLDQIERMFVELDCIPNRLEVWVNSASVMKNADLSHTTPDDWDQTMALNLRAPWLCACQAAQRMQPGGCIINLTDTGARKTWTRYGAYVVSKAGLEVVTRLLARSLGPAVRVNAVAPGLILPPDDMPAGEWQRMVERLPLKRAGDTNAIVEAVLFLIHAEYITGEVLTVDGGYALV